MTGGWQRDRNCFTCTHIYIYCNYIMLHERILDDLASSHAVVLCCLRARYLITRYSLFFIQYSTVKYSTVQYEPYYIYFIYVVVVLVVVYYKCFTCRSI